MKAKHHNTIATKCPACKATLSAATGMNSQEKPGAGDLSFCMYCQAILIFNEDETQRMATDAELAAIPDKIKRALALAMQVASILSENRPRSGAS